MLQLMIELALHATATACWEIAAESTPAAVCDHESSPAKPRCVG